MLMGDVSHRTILVDWLPFECNPELIRESREHNDGKVILKGILQRADVVNQNGRIYPRDVLAREVQNYQKFIRENRALGECVDDATDIMTADGWRALRDVHVGDAVCTLDHASRDVVMQPIIDVVDRYHGTGLMRFSVPGTLDMVVTSEHRVMMIDCGGGVSYMPASVVRELLVCHSDALRGMSIPCSKDQRDTCLRVPLDHRIIDVSIVDYVGRVYCVRTRNGNWLAKRSGLMFWTGNCDHPESAIVELKNASHIVREASIDDDAVTGVVELLNTPSGKILQSLLESGVKLGISSRGVGSTKKKGEYQVVQDDYQLICFDFVSEPSTSNAFMLRESVGIDREQLGRVFTRSDRIDRALNEIIGWREHE